MKIVNKTGYLKGAKTAKNPVNIIPSNLITTQGMAFPIKANGKTLYPNTGQYKFPTSPVVETPLKQKGTKNTKANPIPTPSLGSAFFNPKQSSNNIYNNPFTAPIFEAEMDRNAAQSLNVEKAKRKAAAEEMRRTGKFPKASGRVDMTASPIDVGIAAAAGIPGLAVRGLTGILGTSIPGTGGALTVGQGLNAYGAYDAIANRAPSLVRNIKKENYGGAAEDLALGTLGLYGLKQSGAMNPKKLEAVRRLTGKKLVKAEKNLQQKANAIKYNLEDQFATLEDKAYGLINSGKNTKKIISKWKQQKNPQFLSEQEENLFKQMRNIGMMNLFAAENQALPELLKIQQKTKNVPDKIVKGLTGKSKSQIDDLIKDAQQQNPQLAQSMQNLKQNATASGVSRNDIDWNFIETGYVGTGNIATYKSPNRQYYHRSGSIGPQSRYQYKGDNIVDKFNTKLDKFLTKRLNLEKQTPIDYNSEDLIGSLGAHEGQKKTMKKLIEATNKVKNANEGKTFIPSSSLSTDSYPLSYKILPGFLEKGEIDVGYHGYQNLNLLGLSNRIGLNPQYNLKEFNTVIDKIRKVSGKNIPYAYMDDSGNIQAPIISATRTNVGLKGKPIHKQTPRTQLPSPPQSVSIDDIDDGLGEAPWPPFKKGTKLIKYKNGSKGVSLAFSRGEKDPKGGLTQKGVDKYNRATGGNLKMAVTTPPSKLKPGSKAANRRKSFCARMSGVKGPMAKNGKPTRKALALRKWNC
jgi:hypothetical protein